MISMWKSEEKDKKILKIIKMARNRAILLIPNTFQHIPEKQTFQFSVGTHEYTHAQNGIVVSPKNIVTFMGLLGPQSCGSAWDTSTKMCGYQ